MTEHYKIQEAANLTELNKSTLYYYEKVGIMLPIPRDENGCRLYTDRHLEWIRFLKCMKKTGMTLETLKDFAILHQAKGRLGQRLEILVDHQEKMAAEKRELEAALTFISKKIEMFREAIERYPEEA